MQVQPSSNDNTSFGAIMCYKVKGKDFREFPEMAQKIFKKFAPKDTFAFEGSVAKAVLKSKNYDYFWTQMIYGADMPYKNGVSLLIYEKPEGNMITRAWKYIKASMAYTLNKEESSKSYAEVSPSELSGYGNSFEEAVNNLINKIDKDQIPSKDYYINRTTH